MKSNFSKLFFSLIFCLPIYSQNFQSGKDSLLTLKNLLTHNNVILKSNIDSLTILYSSLSDELTIKLSELTELNKKLFVKKYGREDGQRIASGKIWKGMTMDMLKDIWGKPDKVISNKFSYGVYTQWFYGDITYFFKNSVLIDWEQGTGKKN